jgi:gas vesicle protein
MSRFTNGLLVGLGVSLLFAPRTGQEMRHLLAERFSYLRGIPPENRELKQQVQDMGQRVQEMQHQAERAAEMGSMVQDSGQQTASRVSSVHSELKHVAQQAGTDAPSPGSGPAAPTRPNRPNRPGP